VHTPRATNHHPSTVPAPSAIRDVYVLARRRDDVLLLLRSGTGYRDGEWGPPAGKVEPGETYAEAAARELAEETGIRVGPLDLRFLHVVERVPLSGNHWIGLFFEVDVAGAEPVNREPGLHGALGFFPISGLPDRTVDYVRHVIEATRRGEGHSTWRHLEVED